MFAVISVRSFKMAPQVYGDQGITFHHPLQAPWHATRKGGGQDTLLCKRIYINRNLFSFVLLEVTRYSEVASPLREFIARFIVRANVCLRTGMRMKNTLKKVALDLEKISHLYASEKAGTLSPRGGRLSHSDFNKL